MIKNSEVLVVLVNWRQVALTLNLITQLQAQSYRPDIFVTDNASLDESVNILKNEDIILCESNINGGFGYGCNMGIRFGIKHKYKYIWLLNNDVSILDNLLLEKLIAKSKEHKNNGVVGSIIVDKENVTPVHSGFYLDRLTFRIHETSNENILNSNKYSWINAASMIVPSHIFQTVGLFDESFFMYWEDVDLCSRIKKFEYKFYVADNSIVYHSAGTSSLNNKVSRYIWNIDSGYKWVRKNYDFIIYGLFISFCKNLLNSIRFRSVKILVASFLIFQK